MTKHADALRDEARTLVWAAWGALGVSTWSPWESDVAIEVEPLLAFTAFMVHDDPRLLREVVSWVAANASSVSIHQFRHVVTAQEWPLDDSIHALSGHLRRATGKAWPVADTAEQSGTMTLLASEASNEPSIGTPAATQLRIRQVLGATSRAEVLRVLLQREQSGPMTVSGIADAVAATRRQVSSDVDALRRSGFLTVTPGSGPTAYRLARPAAAATLFGPVGRWVPWATNLRLLIGLLDLVTDLETTGFRLPAAEAARQLRPLAHQQAWALAPPPSLDAASDVVAELSDWGIVLARALRAVRV